MSLQNGDYANALSFLFKMDYDLESWAYGVGARGGWWKAWAWGDFQPRQGPFMQDSKLRLSLGRDFI